MHEQAARFPELRSANTFATAFIEDGFDWQIFRTQLPKGFVVADCITLGQTSNDDILPS
jgi:hypothetical protein